MVLAVFLIAASAARVGAPSDGKWREKVLLAVNEEAAAPQSKAEAPESRDAKIEHTPLEKSPRGKTIIIQARILDPSRLFAPLVFARKSGTTRYEAFTMSEKGRRGFRASLPSSMLSEGSFEYFIEAQHEEGGATRLGSPRRPFECTAFDPPPVPIAYTFRTVEPGASVRIDDNEVGKTPLTVALLPGLHSVAVTSSDGRSAEQQLDVKAGRRKMEMQVDLPRQAGGPATLAVISEPSNANVLLDGAVIGRTPFQGELAAGEHVVAVESDGHMREERKLVAREGRDLNVQFALRPLPKSPVLSVESYPPGAVVTLDDKEKGRTPFLEPLPGGRHEVVLKLEGHREVGTDFVMPRDRDLSIKLDLPVGAGTGSRLTLTSTPGGATVTLDGKEVGPTPWSAEIRPGNHQVAVNAPGYLKEERTVQVQANRDSDVTFALNRAPGPGKLHVDTEPPESVVSVDGKQVGASPFTGEVAPGEHQLEVSNEGYKTIAQQLQLDPGQQLSFKLVLQKAQKGQVPPLIAVASDPQGAQLYVDGKLVGPTPVKVRSTPGPHEIKLALEGYVTRTGRAVLPDTRDFELRMAISLRPVRGVAEKHEAPSTSELARAQIALAHACAKTGDYDCALKGYLKAYEYDSRPQLLFNIAQLRRKAGQFAEASRAYQAFLKEVPKGQDRLKDEAEKQLAFCEARLAGPAVAVASAPAIREEEDLDPPILTHDPVKKAMRGQPVRLTARIVDERSGVATPQACWRNLYRKDFECQPMGKIGENEYGIEVPAKSVNDGFAYYLEAYDNNDNGPARSGAPELPNAVAVEDLPRPPRTVVAAVATEPVKVAAPATFQAAPVAAVGGLGETAHGLPQPPPRKTHLVSFIAMGGAVAAMVAGGALTIDANNSADDLSRNVYPADRAHAMQVRIDNDRLISKVLFGVGAALAVGAVALWSF